MTPPLVPRGYEAEWPFGVEALGVLAAWAQGWETTWETEGPGGWGELEGTGGVCAGCGMGMEPTGALDLAPVEETEKIKVENLNHLISSKNNKNKSCSPPLLPDGVKNVWMNNVNPSLVTSFRLKMTYKPQFGLIPKTYIAKQTTLREIWD